MKVFERGSVVKQPSKKGFEKNKNSARRWCFAFLGTLLFFLAALCLFNGLVDPFGLFGDPIFHWYSYNETNNPRAAKIAYLEEHHQEYDSYIIGPSSTSSFPKEALDRYFDGSFYNLFMYGTDLSDVEQTCLYILENYEVKNLVVNVFIASGSRYGGANDDLNNTLHEKVSGENPLLFYGKYLTVDPRYSLEKIKAFQTDSYLPQAFDVFCEASGAYDKTGRDAEPIGAMEDYLEAYPVFADYPQEVRKMEHIEEAVESVRKIQEKCREKGARLLVVSAPSYYESLFWYEKEEVAKFYLELAKVAPFWDFTASSLSLDPRFFYDETHFRNAAGDMALARIFGDESVYVPEDFGVLVTPENAESHVEKFWEISGDSSEGTAQVPILLYHHIAEETNGSTITPRQFEEEIRLLWEQGYETVTFDQMIAYVKDGKALPEKAVCITFDDGYRSNYEYAYPILKKYGMKATIFVIGASVGSTEYYKDTDYPITPHFNFEEAKEMVDSGVISIQSHTYDMHQYGPYEQGENFRGNILRLEGESEQEYIETLTADFTRSKTEIEEGVGKEVRVLSYPGGSYDLLSQAVLNSLGVEATLSIREGKAVLVKGLPQSLYAMKRFYVTTETSEEQFLNWIS